MKNLKKLACALVLSGLVGVTQAASVTINPTSQMAMIGEAVSVEVLFSDFTDPLISGGFNFNYDTSFLDFDSIDFGANPLGLAFFPIDTAVDGVVGISFAGPLSLESGILGTLNFVATDLGTASLSTAAASPGFFDGSSYYVPGFGNASIEVSAVPVPAAVWLMASGLLGMVGLSRRT
ncbi:MAG: hypothetical protein KKA36_02545 [Gammaproteobacteria bacterium]|nr:hypothetical protein [Gammaproteobacteria bacterium]MBU2477943.1 hypothetical protein [Gammaproteobacteria bacterium]